MKKERCPHLKCKLLKIQDSQGVDKIGIFGVF